LGLPYGYKVFGSAPRQTVRERGAGVGVARGGSAVGVSEMIGISVTCGAQAGNVRAIINRTIK